MGKKLIFFTASLLITVVILFFGANFLIKKTLQYLITNYVSDNITVGDVKSSFLPFYLKLESASVLADGARFDLKDLEIKFSLLKYIQGKGYLSIGATSIKGEIQDRYFTTPSKPIDMGMFGNINLGSILLNIHYKDVDATLASNTVQYNRINNSFSLPYLSCNIKKGEFNERFIGRVKFAYSKRRFSLDYLDIKGDNIDVSLVSKENNPLKKIYRSRIKGEIRTGLLHLLNDHLNGNISFEGDIDNFNVNIKGINQLNIDNKYSFDFTLLIKGDLSKEIQFGTSDLIYKNRMIFIKGAYNIQNKNLQLNIAPFKGIVLLDDNATVVSMGNTSITYSSDGKGSLAMDVTSRETYHLTSDFTKRKDKLLFDFTRTVISSSTSKLTGTGTADLKGLSFSFTGRLNNNPDLYFFVMTGYNGNVVCSVAYRNGKFSLKGTYNSQIEQNAYGIHIKRLNGSFDLTLDNISFVTEAILNNGSLNVNGFIDFNNKDESYKLTTEKVPFNEILHFFQSKTEISYPVTGTTHIYYRKDRGYSGEGNLRLDNTPLKETYARISFHQDILKIDSFRFENNELRDLLTFDFSKNTVTGGIRAKQIIYSKFPPIRDVNVAVSGNITNPALDGTFKVDYNSILKNRRVVIGGNLDNITFIHKADKLSVKVLLTSLKELDAQIVAEGYKYDNATIFGELSVKSGDLKSFNGKADEVKIYYNGNFLAELKNLQFGVTDGRLTKCESQLNINSLPGAFLKVEKADKSIIAGSIEFKNCSNHFFKYVDINKISGIVKFTYNYKGYPDLYGELNGIFDVLYDDIRLKLKNNKINIIFNGQGYKLTVKSKYLDGQANSEKYYSLKDLYATLKFKDIFLKKGGFYGTINGELSYTGENNMVSGAIDIENSVFNYGYSSSNLASGTPKELPFGVNVKIKTKKPVKITNTFIDGEANISLTLEGDKKYTMRGEVSLSNSSFTIGSDKFIVNKGYLKMLDENTIFIVLEAYGTGALSSTKIVVQGYLPNYNIAVYDRELKGTSMFNTSGQGSVALLGRLVSEGIFRDILKISNNLFGINRVGVEPSPGGGVFRVGKRFNDRIEVSYIANVNETTENRVSGDYKFLDWFKMSIFSTAKGGTGAGFTFSIDY